MNRSAHQLARRRSLVALGAMIVGIVLGYRYPVGEWLVDGSGALVWFALACGVLAVSLVLHRFGHDIVFSIGLVIGVSMLGGGLIETRTHDTPPDRLDAIVARSLAKSMNNSVGSSRSRVPIEIVGTLSRPIETKFYAPAPGWAPTWASERVSSLVRIERVYSTGDDGRGTWVKASGIARLVLPMSMRGGNGFEAGDRVRIVGLFSASGEARNFGDLDWGALSRQGGRVGTVVVGDESLIEHEAIGGLFDRLGRWRVRTQARIRQRALESLGLGVSGSGTNKAVLGALLLGQRDPSFGDVYEAFQHVGVAHVLAISGFHLALVIYLALLAVRGIGEHPRVEIWVVVLILVAGATVLPMKPPIVRAGVIVGALIFTGGIGRRYDRMTVLAWVGVGLLIWRPMDVFSLGYQLSMGITALLVMLGDRQREARGAMENRVGRSMLLTRGAGRGLARKIWGWCIGWLIASRQWAWSVFRVNLACWVVAMPAIAYHAGVVSFLAPIVSLVLIPMVTATMVLGYGQIALGMLWPAMADRTIAGVDRAGGLMSSMIQWVAGIPWSWVSVGSIGPIWTLAATGGLVLIVTQRVRVRSVRAALIGTGLGVWLMAGSITGSIMDSIIGHERSVLRIDMLDVGDGSGVLIQSDGQGLIWDCGSLSRPVGQSAARAARAIGLGKISDAIITHDNLDHYNGLIELGRSVGLERVWVSKRMLEQPSAGWSDFAQVLDEMGVELRELGAGTTIVLGQVELRCIWPVPELIETDGEMTMSENNASVVVQIVVPVRQSSERGESDQLGGDSTRTVLLTGDIEREAMEAIRLAHPNLRADIVELPHHGSTKPGALAFVQSLEPAVVLQSTGPSRLGKAYWDRARAGRVWYTTAGRGGAWVRIMPDGSIVHGWARP
jgi:competence protein ComEC